MKKHLLKSVLMAVALVIGATGAWAQTWTFTDQSVWGSVALNGGAQYDENANAVTSGGVTFTGTSGFVSTSKGIGFNAVGSTSDDNISIVVPAGYKASVSVYTSSNRTVAAEAALSTGRPLHRLAPDTDKYPARVDNLLTTMWSQDEPYKNHTPLMPNGDNYVTGCVATSMAQVLAYHRLPIRGQGEASVMSPLGEPLTASFGTTLYDWDRMKSSYNYLEQDYTFEEGEAVATLMAHCGVACKMTYNETGSGAFNDDAAIGLQQYFGFKNARNVRRSNYPSDEAWMNLIFDELAHRSPIMFGAQSTYGHSFVFTGYNEEGLVYVNWGWGGQKNGWFDVNVLDPDQNGGFVTNQQMIIGIRSYQPDVAEMTVTTTEAGTLAQALDPALTYGRLKIVGPINDADLKHLRDRINSARIADYPNAADTYAVDLSEASIDDLPDMVFNGCTNLRYLTLPASLKTIGAGAFGGCMALTSLTMPAEATGGDYAIDDNIVYNGNRTRVIAVLADAMGDLHLDEGVTHIGDYAFASLYDGHRRGR